MKEIQHIYQNDLGASFFWKTEQTIHKDKVQLVFKETGLQLKIEDLVGFKSIIEDSISRNHCCEQCQSQNDCTKYLLQTPIKEIDLAMSIDEMIQMNNLITTTIFKISLENYIWGEGLN
jgi:ACT domain-containing protein